jgi:RNA polymerase sigma factor (sigma-70 family)
VSEIPKYNFFISYANEDRALAQRLHQLLAGKGFVSSFEDFDSSSKNSRNKIFKAVYDSAVCVLIIGSRKQSPWWDDQICKAIKERVSTSHGEYRVVSILLSTPQHLHDLSFQIDWGFQSGGRIHYSDVIDDPEKLHELIRLIRGADRQSSLLANGETREWATTRAKNALDVDWEKLYSGHQSQSESQSIRLKTTEDPESVERRKRFHEKAQEYLEILSAFVTRFTREHELAQEIAQRTIVNYLSRREADNWQQDIKNEAAFLFQMARNLLRDEWRAHNKARPMSLDQPLDDQVRKVLSQLTDSFDVEKQLYLEELLQTLPLKTIFGGLSERQRKLLYLHTVEELSYDEICKEVNYDPIIVRYELQKIYATVRARVKKTSTSYSGVELEGQLKKCERFRG